jgi:hypothetical protein
VAPSGTVESVKLFGGLFTSAGGLLTGSGEGSPSSLFLQAQIDKRKQNTNRYSFVLNMIRFGFLVLKIKAIG